MSETKIQNFFLFRIVSDWLNRFGFSTALVFCFVEKSYLRNSKSVQVQHRSVALLEEGRSVISLHVVNPQQRIPRGKILGFPLFASYWNFFCYESLECGRVTTGSYQVACSWRHQAMSNLLSMEHLFGFKHNKHCEQVHCWSLCLTDDAIKGGHIPIPKTLSSISVNIFEDTLRSHSVFSTGLVVHSWWTCFWYWNMVLLIAPSVKHKEVFQREIIGTLSFSPFLSFWFLWEMLIVNVFFPYFVNKLYSRNTSLRFLKAHCSNCHSEEGRTNSVTWHTVLCTTRHGWDGCSAMTSSPKPFHFLNASHSAHIW